MSSTTNPTPEPPTATPSTHPGFRVYQPQQTMGIDIHKALEILSARSQVSHHHHHHHDPSVGTGDSQQQQCCGSTTISDNTIGMGQTIDLLAPTTSKDKKSDESSSTTDDQELLEEQRKLLEEERRKRRLEIQNELNAMSMRELLQQVMKAQQGRVATYRDYERYVQNGKKDQWT
jgi:hypothetical protein